MRTCIMIVLDYVFMFIFNFSSQLSIIIIVFSQPAGRLQSENVSPSKPKQLKIFDLGEALMNQITF